MTAYVSEYRNENREKVFSISFDPPINIKDGCTRQERNAIDEFNKIMAEIEAREKGKNNE